MDETIATLPLVGGHPGLDLVNTMERGIPRPASANQDFLTEPGALLIWAERAGLTSPEEHAAVRRAWTRAPEAAVANLRSVHELRESLHAVLQSLLDGTRDTDPALAPALEVLKRHWLEAMGRSQLDPSGAGASLALKVGVEALWMPVDRVAATAFDLLRSTDMLRLRRCPVDEGGCGWMFVDRTRNGSRRWCRMADCGTQVKSRRLTERRRERRRTPEMGPK